MYEGIMIVQRRLLEAQLLEWICMGKELPYEVTISREQAYSPGGVPRYRGHIHAHPQQQKE